VPLILGLIFGVIGSSYILYGRRQLEPWYIVSGFALVVYPYFFSNAFLILLIGTLLVLFPIAKGREWI